jgi:hypothetical protein
MVLPLGLTPNFSEPIQVSGHHCFLRFADFLFGEGKLHAQNFGAVKKAVGVLVQTENGRAIDGLVGTNAFKGAAAVVQGVG